MGTAAIIPLATPMPLELHGVTVHLLAMRTPHPTPAGVADWRDADGRPYVDAPAFICEAPGGARGEAWVEPTPGPDGQRHILQSRGPGEPASLGTALSPAQIDALTDLYRRTLQPEAPAQHLPAA